MVGGYVVLRRRSCIVASIAMKYIGATQYYVRYAVGCLYFHLNVAVASVVVLAITGRRSRQAAQDRVVWVCVCCLIYYIVLS